MNDDDVPHLSITSKTKKDADFGRSELAALLGGDLPERLLRPTTTTTATHTNLSSRTKKGLRKDVADMTVAETAAMILEQQHQKAQRMGASSKTPLIRHRAATQKQKQYHELLLEQQQKQATSTTTIHDSFREEPDEIAVTGNDFIVRLPQKQRVKAAPVVVLGKKENHRARRRHVDEGDSSSSSSSDDDEDDDASSTSPRRQRRRSSSSSDEDDDSSTDRRRKRIWEQRRSRHPIQSEPSRDVSMIATKIQSPSNAREEEVSSSRVPTDTQPKESRQSLDIHDNQKNNKDIETVKTSSEEEDSSNDESSASSSSEEDEEIPVQVVKPVFVPKQKRSTVQTMEKEEQEAAMAAQRQMEREKRRIRESRAMVQQVLQESAKNVSSTSNTVEGITGAMNEMPNDDDNDDDIAARDAWQVRELERLLEDWDRQQEKLRAQKQERIDDNTNNASLKQQQKEEDRHRKSSIARYYHRGAFYMDESEWDASDVRHKASEYAQAVTGDDKIDRSILPKVMQVKKFGFANRSKWKGLAAEDTTRAAGKPMDMLPLPQQQPNKKSNKRPL
jgi:microfibrillar-associated protein 1